MSRTTYSHGMLFGVLLVQGVSLLAWWRGGWLHVFTHVGLALCGIALLTYTSSWEPAPSDERSSKIQVVVMSILVALMHSWVLGD